MLESPQSASFWPSMMEPFRSLTARFADWFAPAAEASRKADAYEIRMELPGVKREDIDVSVVDGALIVKGEKKDERTEKTDTYFFSERQYGSFQRNFRLPADADAEKLAAEFKDGVLIVKAPRKGEPAPEAKRIAVQG